LQARLEKLEQTTPDQSNPRSRREDRRRPAKQWAASSPGAGDDVRPPSSAGFPVAPAQWGVRLGGFVQVQYQHSQLSEDQLQQGGVVLNRDRFMVRRGRLRASGDWRCFAFDFEIDGSTTRGPFIGIRQANVSALWRHRDPKRVPYVMVTAGLTEVPFGHELRVGQRDLLFMERSLGSLAFFPGPVDVGVRVRGGVGPLRYDVAAVNGSPLDDRADGPSGLDPTKRPDFAGRLGFEALPSIVAIGGGASFLTGTGFHPGRDATKNVTQWQDLNENGTLDSGEITSVPGTAAGPSLNFGRWALGADLELGVRTKTLGWSTLTAEATLAQNLDRGLFPADPVVIGSNLRHLQALVGITQDLGRWAAAGVRYDVYDPNTDLLDRRRGETVPRRSDIHTISPLVAARLPAGITPGFRGRLVIQYDAVLDHLGRDERGVPVNLRNDQLTVRVQGEF